MRFFNNVVFQHLDETRLPNARFAAQQNDLPVSIAALRPAFQEQSDFLFTANQRCETTNTRNIQAALNATFLKNPVYGYRLGYTP
jgi:hypothetical protein